MRQWVASAKSDIDSFLFIGEQPGDQAGEVLTRTGDGTSFLIGVPQHDVNDESNTGAVYLVSAADLALLDASDGRTDRAIDLRHVPDQSRSWKLTDVSTYQSSWSQNPVVSARRSDGVADGVPDTDDLFPKDRTRSDLTSYRVVLEARDGASNATLASAGDLDGDGSTEMLVASPRRNEEGIVYVVSLGDLAADAADGSVDSEIILENIAAYIIMAADLPHLDAADGRVDGAILLS